MRRGWKDLIKLNLVTAFGVTVVSNILIAGLLGYWIDKLTSKDHVFLVIFLFIGVISGLYNGIRQLLKEAERYERLDREDDENDDDSHGD